MLALVSVAEFLAAADSRAGCAGILGPDRMNRIASTICLLSLLTACGGDTEVSFGPPRKVPKEKRPLLWQASMRDRLGVPDMSNANDSAPAGPMQVVATTPDGWEELPANPRKFRNAVWRIQGEPETDCYMTIGVGGGVSFNLTRWYTNQFGKKEVPALQALPPVELAGRSGRLVELVGTMNSKPDWAALIAFYNQGEQVTSLKFTGPKAIVLANKKSFLSLAKSIRLASASPNAKAPPIQPGAKAPNTPSHAAGHGEAPPAATPFTADVPAGWQAKADSRRILHHTFGKSSELYLSQLGGSLKQSLDIWRGEIGMGPLSDAEFAALPKALFLGDDGVMMDLAGTFRGMTGTQIDNARLLVAARLDGTSITFCKLVGPKAEVDDQQDAFTKFCGSIRKAQ